MWWLERDHEVRNDMYGASLLPSILHSQISWRALIGEAPLTTPITLIATGRDHLYSYWLSH
jgi:hypothetical protein